MSFLAQQLLQPRDAQLPEIPWVTSLVDHYNTYQASSYHTPSRSRCGSAGAVQFVSGSSRPDDTKIGPHDVDKFTSPRDGVWYPDLLMLGMAWRGSGCSVDAWQGNFNPFAPVSSFQAVDFFTEKLKGAAVKLQWAMPQYAQLTAADRSNLAVASQDSRPDWLSKPGYLHFGALRAYPLMQLRRLCVALHERTLPLDHPAVLTLIHQLLYHLGELKIARDSGAPALLWRSEWDADVSDLLPTLCEEVGQLVKEQKPRTFQSAILLGELAAYLCDWHQPFLLLARRLASVAALWADDLEAQAATSSGVRTKQCLLRMTAQVTFLSAELSV